MWPLKTKYYAGIRPKVILLIVSLMPCANGSLRAQFAEQEIHLPIQLITVAKEFEIDWQKETLDTKGFSMVQVQNVYLFESDLVVEVEDVQTEMIAEDVAYVIRASLRSGSAILQELLPTRLRQQPQKFVFKDALETLLEPDKAYVISLNVEGMGEFCAEPAPFHLRQRLPYYGAGLAGLVLLGTGEIFRRQYDKDQKVYEEAWRNGEPDPGGTKNIQDKFNTYRALTIAGAIVLGLDVGGFVWRIRARNRHIKLKKKYCPPDFWQAPPAKEKASLGKIVPKLEVGEIGLAWQFTLQ